MIDEAPPTPEDRLTTIAENIEVTVSNLFGLLIVRDEWPEYQARPL